MLCSGLDAAFPMQAAELPLACISEGPAQHLDLNRNGRSSQTRQPRHSRAQYTAPLTPGTGTSVSTTLTFLSACLIPVVVGHDFPHLLHLSLKLVLSVPHLQLQDSAADEWPGGTTTLCTCMKSERVGGADFYLLCAEHVACADLLVVVVCHPLLWPHF